MCWREIVTQKDQTEFVFSMELTANQNHHHQKKKMILQMKITNLVDTGEPEPEGEEEAEAEGDAEAGAGAGVEAEQTEILQFISHKSPFQG